MGSWRLVAILAAAVLLCGCTTAVPSGGLSTADRAEIQRQYSDNAWRSSGLPASLRPADPPSEAVSQDEWAVKFAGCMNDAGYDNYRARSNRLTVEVSGDITNQEKLTSFDCRLRFTVDYSEAGYLNPDQLDYQYDYLEQYLVPCLKQNGYEIEEAPTREQFHDEFGSWNPYWSIPGMAQNEAAADTLLHARCPPMPPGFAADEFFG